jgi:AcrR family transcriptional regulator
MTFIRHKASTGSTTGDSPADDAYLDAARAAILAVGWSRTTLTDIARRAGVSRMTLYRRWPDTQTLLADLMTREWAGVVDAAAHEAAAEHDARTRIATGVVATVRALRENDLVRRIVDVDPEVLLPYLLDRRGRSQEHVAEATAALVEAGQRDGSVRVGDPTTMARALLLAAHGFVLSAHTMLDGEAHAGIGRDADVSHLDAELALLVDRYLAPAGKRTR